MWLCSLCEKALLQKQILNKKLQCYIIFIVAEPEPVWRSGSSLDEKEQILNAFLFFRSNMDKIIKGKLIFSWKEDGLLKCLKAYFLWQLEP